MAERNTRARRRRETERAVVVAREKRDRRANQATTVGDNINSGRRKEDKERSITGS